VSLGNPTFLSFLGYLIVVVVVGLLTYRFMRAPGDFFLGGRRLSVWIIAISERASGESGWFLLGLPGLAYASGVQAFWAVVGCAWGIFLSWNVIAPRLRAYVVESGVLTIPSYFEDRFADRSGVLRLVSLLVIVFFYTFYVAAQCSAAGKILNAAFEVPQFWGMVIGAVVIIFYTLMGGFLAVAITDFVQGALMVFASVVLPLVGLAALGGWEALVQKVAAIDPSRLLATGGTTGHEAWLGIAVGGLAIGLGYIGQPHLLVRFMALRRQDDVRKGTAVAIGWVLLAYWGAAFVGLVGLGVLGGGLGDPEQVMPLLATSLLPAWIAGIIISGAIAAMMSTADSQLLVATSALAEDLYHRTFRRGASPRALVRLSRIATVVLGALAFLVAWKTEQIIYWFVLYAWAGLGASFGPPLLLSLWWKGTTKWGAFASMVVGTTTVVVWYNISALKGVVYELVPGFLFSLLACVLVSMLGRKARAG
jgi:sodium/proline symporter